MNYYRYLLFVFICCLLVSCNESGSFSQKGHIDVASALSNPGKLEVSDYFSGIRYVPLETTEESLVGEGATVRLVGDKIVVTTAQKQCLLFDKGTGRFLTSVGHIGNDPEGYRAVAYLADELNRELCFQGWQNNWVCYDLEGRYRRSMPLSISTRKAVNVLSSTYVDGESYVSYISDFFPVDQDSLYFFTADRQVHAMAVTEEDHQEFNVNDIASISVLNSTSGREYGGPAGLEGVLLLDYKEPNKGSATFMGAIKLWHVGEELFYKGTYNDTVYAVKDFALTPSYVFELGEYHWPYADRFNKKREKSVLITQVLDSKEHLFFSFITDLFGSSKTLYNGLFTKSTGRVEVALLEQGITDNRYGFLPLQPLSVAPSGEYAGLLEAYHVADWFEDNPDKVGELPQELKALRGLDGEDNPVVFILNN